MIKYIVIPGPLKKKLKDKKTLPAQMQKNFHWFYWCMDMLLKNEASSLLRRKKVEGSQNYWEFTIAPGYKGIYRKEKDTAFIVAAGICKL